MSGLEVENKRHRKWYRRWRSILCSGLNSMITSRDSLNRQRTGNGAIS